MGIKNYTSNVDIPLPLKKVKNSFFNFIDEKYKKEYEHYSEKIKKFNNIHKNQRCFIVGTGPSLKKTNMKLLKNEIIFGVNKLYKGINKFNINCDYYAISDVNVWKKHYNNVLKMDTNLFISTGVGKDYIKNKSQYELIQKKEPFILKTKGYMTVSKEFSKDASKYVVGGHTIIVDICLQMAYYMGFKEIYLLGCDCSYKGKQHFDGLKHEFQFEGEKKENRHWKMVFESYEICKKAFEDDNRKIYNSTVGGNLEIFERKKLEDVI